MISWCLYWFHGSIVAIAKRADVLHVASEGKMGRKSKTPGDLVVIKKYANRRLYDTSTSSYVTLDHLSELVRQGIDFEVRDAKSKEDITKAVLTQIIFEHETKGDGALPLSFLRKLIGSYGGQSQALLPAWLEVSMNSFSNAQKRWLGSAKPMALLAEQTKRNMAMFESAMRMFTPSSSGETDEEEDISHEDLLAEMQDQMAEMRAQLDRLSDETDT